MQGNNTTLKHFGWVSILLHWLIALLCIGLFALGYWMVDLSYYSKWYNLAPLIHQSFGIILVLLVVMRTLWYFIVDKVDHLPTHKRYEVYASIIVKFVLTAFICVMFVSGYIIVTAKGGSLSVFNLVELPPIPEFLQSINRLSDYAGEIHEITAYTLIAVAIVHALAALKHHFIDKDITLKRILFKR